MRYKAIATVISDEVGDEAALQVALFGTGAPVMIIPRTADTSAL